MSSAVLSAHAVLTVLISCVGAERAALQDSGEQWSQLGSSFEADIQLQPSLLKGGELRDYQMKVEACQMSWPTQG